MTGDAGGVWEPSPHWGWMWQNAKRNLPALPIQKWRRERACERHDGMSFTVRTSLGDSCNVYRPALMTVGRGGGHGPALFRQELGLSSDSKIPLIYDISTRVVPSPPLTPTNKHPAGRWWHSAKLFVYLLLSPQRIHFPYRHAPTADHASCRAFNGNGLKQFSLVDLWRVLCLIIITVLIFYSYLWDHCSLIVVMFALSLLYKKAFSGCGLCEFFLKNANICNFHIFKWVLNIKHWTENHDNIWYIFLKMQYS